MAGLINLELSEYLQQNESVVVAIGLSLTDQLSLPWQDGVSIFKTTTGTAGNDTHSGRFTEDLPMAPQGDKAALLFALLLPLSDQLSLSEGFGRRYFFSSGTGVASFVTPYDQLLQKDVVTVNLIGALSMSLTDNLNAWLDPTLTLVVQLQLALACPHLGQNWLDAVSTAFGTSQLTETLADTLSMSDSLALEYGQGSVDSLTFLDSNAIGFGDIISDTLALSDSEIIGFGNATVDSLTFQDTNSLGYGDLISDALTLLDGLAIGYGQGEVDSLTFSDQNSIGYGDLISDTLALSDVLSSVLSFEEQLGDAITGDVQLGLDNCQRADENPINPATWSQGFGHTTQFAKLLSNNIEPAQNTPIIYYWSAVAWPADQFSEITIQASASGAQSVTVWVRMSATVSTGYNAGLSNQPLGVGSTIVLQKDVATVGTVLASKVLNTAAGDVFRLEVIGSNLFLYVNGILQLTATDSAIATGNAGFSLTSGATLANARISQWRGGSLVSLGWQDSETNVLGLMELLADTATLSDSLTLGQGNAAVDSLTFIDSNAVGYGDLIADTLTLTDALVALMSGGSSLSVSDTITISDSMLLGYGFLITDTLSLSDSAVEVLGMVEVLTDALTESDNLAIGYGNQISDTLTLSDRLAIGYGDLISDQLTMSEALVMGFGQGTVDSLTFSDSNGIGFGDLISDTMTLTDALIKILGINELLSDTLTFSDATTLGYGQGTVDALSFSDSNGLGYGDQITDTLTMSDAFAFNSGAALITLGLADTLSLTDQLGLGYGDLIVDTMTLADGGEICLLSSEIDETLADQITLTDALGVGYGQGSVDSITFSDSNSLGFGDLIADTMTESDLAKMILGQLETLADTITLLDSLTVGYGNGISDTLTLSDGLVVGYGQGTVDALTFADSSSIGYGDLIADALSESDAFAFQLNNTTLEIDKTFADTLTLLDSETIGFGNGLTESLTFLDQSGIGYGDLIADTLSMADQMLASMSGGGILTETDTLVMSDSNLIGYGDLIADVISVTDSTLVGYGDLLSDTMSMSDSIIEQLSIAKMFTDTLTESDAITGIGYGNAVADQLTQTDAQIFGYGNATVDQLIIQDQSSVGYGDLISDSLNNWIDAFSFNAGIPGLTLSVNDVMTILDSCLSEYGSLLKDNSTMTDQMQLVESFQLLLAEATPAMLDALQTLLTFGLQNSDSMVFLEQMNTLYGLIMAESLTQTDSLSENLIGPLSLILADTEVAAWFDQVLTLMVFAPGEVVIAGLSVMSQMVANQMNVQGEQKVSLVMVEVE